MKEDALVVFLQSGQLAWAFIVVLILWLTKLDIAKLIELRISDKSKDIEILDKILTAAHFDNSFTELMKNRLAEQLFERHFGIAADERYRNALIKLNKKEPAEANWIRLRRAYPYLRLDCKDKPFIEIKLKDKLEKWFILITVLLIGLYGVIIFALGIISFFAGGKGTLQLEGLAVAIFSFAAFFSSLNWPYKSAQKLEAVLNKDNKTKKVKGQQQHPRVK